MAATEFQNFPWQAFRVVFTGTSSIDTPQLELKSEAEAHQFLLAYGFDWHKPSHADRLRSIYADAQDFIERVLLKGKTSIPAEFRGSDLIEDLRHLLLFASRISPVGKTLTDSELRRIGSWACVILRVMHTLIHLESDLRLKYIDKIKKQTLERIQAHLQRQEEKTFLGFERDKVPLTNFELKEGKIKDSILIKLLHKPENVAQEVYDHLGVRFITPKRVDAFRVVRYLIEHHLISVPNIMPSRCRNTLVNLDEFSESVSKGTDLDELGFDKMESSLSLPSLDQPNRFSSAGYRSVQFTCRSLIRIPAIRKGVKSEISFFFPIEIQILDEESYKTIQSGDAEHQEYKRKQLEAVQKRVLSGVEEFL